MSLPSGDARAARMMEPVTAPVTQRRRSSADFDLNDVIMVAPASQKGVVDIRADSLDMPPFAMMRPLKVQTATTTAMAAPAIRADAAPSPAPTAASPGLGGVTANERPALVALVGDSADDDEHLELPTDFDVARNGMDVDNGEYEDICDEAYLLRHSPPGAHATHASQDARATAPFNDNGEKALSLGSKAKAEWALHAAAANAVSGSPATGAANAHDDANAGAADVSLSPHSNGDDSPADEQRSSGGTHKGCNDADGGDDSPRSVGSKGALTSPGSLGSLWNDSGNDIKSSGAVAVTAAST